MLNVPAVEAVADDQTLHLARDDRRVVTKNFDALEGKQPARVGRRPEGCVHAARERKEHGKVVGFGVLMRRADSMQRRHFAEQKADQVEHVYGGLVKKASGKIWI